MTLPYYDEHGKTFFERTATLNLEHIYKVFEKYLAEGAHILDAGCGSGRDSKVFLERGYKVSAIDGSETMAKLASELAGLDVKHQSFEEMDYEAEFDAVWANASLLHIPKRELAPIFEKIIHALKHHGVFYMSFKAGEDEKTDDFGRHFSFFTEARLRDFVAQFPDLELEILFITEDSRPDHKGEEWLNLIVRKIS